MLKFCFSVITFSLVDRFTHTQCCFGRDLYTDMPHCDHGRKTFICVEKLGEKYKNPVLLMCVCVFCRWRNAIKAPVSCNDKADQLCEGGQIRHADVQSRQGVNATCNVVYCTET